MVMSGRQVGLSTERRIHLQLNNLFEMRSGASEIALQIGNQRQVVKTLCTVVTVLAECSLTDTQRLLVNLRGLCILTLANIKHAEVVQGQCVMGMVLAQGCLPYR